MISILSMLKKKGSSAVLKSDSRAINAVGNCNCGGGGNCTHCNCTHCS